MIHGNRPARCASISNPSHRDCTLTLFAGRVFDTGSAGLGLINTALSVGTIAGTLAATRRRAPGPRRAVISALLFAAAESIAACAPGYGSFLILLVPVGFLSEHAGPRPGLVCGAALAALGTLGIGLWPASRAGASIRACSVH